MGWVEGSAERLTGGCDPGARSLACLHAPLRSPIMNQDLAGKTYPTVQFSVPADRVRRFAEAVGAEGPGVPPTFATVPEIEAMSAVLQDPELELDFSRVVHAEQSYEWTRPIEVGDELTARPSIESIRAKAGSEILVISTEIRDGSGQGVVRGRCTLVVRPRVADGA
jgi:hypothetical protein